MIRRLAYVQWGLWPSSQPPPEAQRAAQPLRITIMARTAGGVGFALPVWMVLPTARD